MKLMLHADFAVVSIQWFAFTLSCRLTIGAKFGGVLHGPEKSALFCE
jgi:hypothetical protein